MRLAQTLRQTPTVSPQLVMAHELLQLSSLELEQAIAQELAENPALEMREVRQCRHCGADLDGGVCAWCGPMELESDEAWVERRDDFPVGEDGGFEPDAPDEWDDPMARLAAKTTLVDHLARQVRLALAPADYPVALYLIESLDDRGYLQCDLDDVAAALSIPREKVAGVLATVQTLDPSGIAARDARECLLIQIDHLGREGVAHPLAERLVRSHWEILGRRSVSSVARVARVSEEQVGEALRFIRDNLNPFPAYAFWASRRETSAGLEAPAVEPDVIIRKSRSTDWDYDIELPKARRTRFRVGVSCRQALNAVGGGSSTVSERERAIWEAYRCRARLFVKSIEQRWQTLYDLTRCLVAYQGDFLAHGEAWLKPLTRARVAEMMGVHESTVSRAVANKYALLPSGEVVGLAKFFDSATPVKRMIQDLVGRETRPLSDQAIADILCKQGFDVARRTVAKYRNALGILPSSQRRFGGKW